jgi:hypothetical protein
VNAFFGSNATFNVRAVGVPPLNYTWHHNLVPLVPGTNGSTLTVTNVGATNLGFYSVIVSNANGSTTSPGAVLQILPVITQRPVSVTNSVGGTASFTVQAIGIPPLTYAWRRTAPVPAFNLVGQTNNSLTFSNLVLTNAGTYLVTVSSGSGVIAVGATLTVTSGSQADAPVLQLPALNGGQFEFRLPTQTGFSYVVQSKTNLSDTNWTQEQVVPGDGTTKTVTVNTTAPVKFLRVIAQ